MIDLAGAIAASPPARHGTSTLIGQVVSSDATTVTVMVGDDPDLTIVAPRLRSYGSPSSGDVVLLVRSRGFIYCLGTLNAAPVPLPPPPAPPPAPRPPSPPAPSKPPSAGTSRPPKPKPKPPAPSPPAKPQTVIRTFRPVFTGSFRAGSWRGDTRDLYQGDYTGRGTNYGAAYYGDGPAGTPRGATAISGTIRIRRLSGGTFGGQSPTLRLLPNRRRPGGAPGMDASTRGPAIRVGATTTVSLPTSWVQRLLNGSSGGIGIGVGGNSPYIVLAGRSSWAAAFELTIKYRR